jgi:hypothetical protein
LGINDLVVEAIAHHHPTRVSHSDLDCSIAVYLADLLAHELEIHANDRREKSSVPQTARTWRLWEFCSNTLSFRARALEALN